MWEFGSDHGFWFINKLPLPLEEIPLLKYFSANLSLKTTLLLNVYGAGVYGVGRAQAGPGPRIWTESENSVSSVGINENFFPFTWKQNKFHF